jgi:dienelactone hydrolase
MITWSVELRAADHLRAAGHEVVTPDLYAGRTASTLDEGFRLKDHRIGWATIEQRVRQAMQNLPADTVLAGISMGAGVVSTLLPHRLPNHNAQATTLTWRRVLDFPRTVSG